MPTLALAEREAGLRRALDSVLSQAGVHAIPLVVVNGGSRDARLVAALRGDHRIRVAALGAADLPAALAAGRRLVDTPFFAELDDDDELMPGGLALRVDALQRAPECDAVVTNGIRRGAAGDVLHVPRMDLVERDPLKALLQRNWLLPGSWLCRTDRVGAELFDGMPRFRECTYIALRLAAEHRIAFLAEPTVVYRTDTQPSASKSPEYAIGGVAALRRIIALDLPPDVRREYRRRVAASHRAIGRLHLSNGRFAAACGWYARSMVQPGGLAYLVRRALRLPLPR